MTKVQSLLYFIVVICLNLLFFSIEYFILNNFFYYFNPLFKKIFIAIALIFNFIFIYYLLRNFPKLPLKVEYDKFFKEEDELDI